MKIAIDLDDVLAESFQSFIDFHNEIYNSNLKFEDLVNYSLQDLLGISGETEIKRVKEFDESLYFDKIQPLKEANEVINELSKEHELIVITSRPLNIEKQTKEWIQKYFPNIKEIYFIKEDYDKNSKTKADICKEKRIKIIIEDNLAFAENCSKEGINVFLFDYPWNQKNILGKNIKRVKSWKEILELFKKAPESINL